LQTVLFNSCQTVARGFGVERGKDTDTTVVKDQPMKTTTGLKKKSQEQKLQHKIQVFSY
jgi:hypothetical protein